MFKRIEEEFTLRVLSSYDFKAIPEIVGQKDIFSTDAEVKDNVPEDTLVCYKREDGYDFYFNRLQMHIISTDDLWGVEVFVCASDHVWGRGTDSPDAEKFRVYACCTEKLLTGHLFDDAVYVSGSWNKYVRENFRKMIRKIEECKESIKFDMIFKTVA